MYSFYNEHCDKTSSDDAIDPLFETVAAMSHLIWLHRSMHESFLFLCFPWKLSYVTTKQLVTHTNSIKIQQLILEPFSIVVWGRYTWKVLLRGLPDLLASSLECYTLQQSFVSLPEGHYFIKGYREERDDLPNFFLLLSICSEGNCSRT